VNRHLNDRQLLSYLDNDLLPHRRDRVAAHLGACPACRARLERMERTAEGLAKTLRAAGERVPLAPSRSWEDVARRWKRQRPKRTIFAFLLPVRYATILAVLLLAVGGIAGLIQTLAVTGPASTQATPTPTATPVGSPSPAPGPLPHASPNRVGTAISILVLGVDGESATSGETDALMLVYLDTAAKRAFLLPIPRDLHVQVPGHGQMRAGSVYGLGERDETAGSLALVRETISATLGLPIEHAALVRFDSFVTLIDTVGGVDVHVPHPIDDPDFPDGHGGKDPFSISAGAQHLDGETALRYARTLVVPAPGFDRSFRQQQLVLAVHDRVTRSDLLSDLIPRSSTLWSAIQDGLETDLTLSDVVDLALLVADHTTSTGEHVLVPRPDEIETLMHSLLGGER
jgi:LCP family protein required for cell wall assembly